MRALAFILLLALTQSTEPAKYPLGQFCTPKGDIVAGKQTALHPCACKRHEDAEDKTMCKAGEPIVPSHDAVCKQWCNESACACPVSCETHLR